METGNEARERLTRLGLSPKRARWAVESAEWRLNGVYGRGPVRVECVMADMHSAHYRVTRRLRAPRAGRTRVR
jgi:hypothetical protein